MDRDLAMRVAERYANGSRAVRGYVAGKLRSDPVIERIVALGRERSLGNVLDLGCGRGQLAVALLEAKVATGVVGIDWDARKIEVARGAATGLPARFEVGDVRTQALDACDTALLVDVLHYMTPSEQDAVIGRVARAARACVLVRELDPDRGWRSIVTRVQEAITTLLGYNAAEHLEYRSISALCGALSRCGFEVAVEPAWGRTPFSNVLIVAKRP